MMGEALKEREVCLEAKFSRGKLEKNEKKSLAFLALKIHFQV